MKCPKCGKELECELTSLSSYTGHTSLYYWCSCGYTRDYKSWDETPEDRWREFLS